MATSPAKVHYCKEERKNRVSRLVKVLQRLKLNATWVTADTQAKERITTKTLTRMSD